jgi:hypothetical protein
MLKSIYACIQYINEVRLDSFFQFVRIGGTWTTVILGESSFSKSYLLLSEFREKPSRPGCLMTTESMPHLLSVPTDKAEEISKCGHCLINPF